MSQPKNNGASVDQQVTFGEGENPGRGRWPFDKLKKGNFFEITDLEKHVALRTAASRAAKKLRRKFSVRKVRREEDDIMVIRVFRR